MSELVGVSQPSIIVGRKKARDSGKLRSIAILQMTLEFFLKIPCSARLVWTSARYSLLDKWEIICRSISGACAVKQSLFVEDISSFVEDILLDYLKTQEQLIFL